MRTVKRTILNYSLLLGIFLLSNSCNKKDMEEKCDMLSSDIDVAKDTYASTPNATNCQRVIEAYDKYINNKCDDAESYINLRDAFQKKNCP
ncbi:MAG: hypothetical protein U0X91_19500 [Spirosomataceae bacterium]